MKNRAIVFTFLAGLLFASALWAKKPWEKKPHTEWTKQEVAQVLSNSPWARSVIFQGNLVLGEEAGGMPPGAPRLIVRWESALTVRQALVQQQELQGNPTGGAGKQFLSTVPPHYVIVMFGPPLSSFNHLTEEVVAESTYLELAGSGKKIEALRALLIRQGRNLVAIEFRFPRQVEGKPAIGPGTKKVAFYCSLTTGFVSAEFDLAKMLRDAQPDL